MNPPAPPIPLIVISGFLGAGKTTLLCELLPQLTAAGVTPHVIINDYRNALVDASQMQGLARQVLPISGTCVCCDSRDELLDTLATLTCGPDSVLLMEANGTADMLELVEMLSADRRARRYSLPIQVGVVDAKRWQKRYWNNALEAAQMKTAGWLVITRGQEVSERRRAEVVEDLRTVQPKARLGSMVDIRDFVVGMSRSAHTSPRRFTLSPHLGIGRAAPHAPVHHPQHHHHHFASMELTLPEFVTRQGLEDFLHALPAEVVRAKGVACFQGSPGQAVLFQKVEGRDGVALKNIGPPPGFDRVAILIGVKCPEEEIRQLAMRHLSA